MRVIFDRCVEGSLKEKTIKKRATLCCCLESWACSARWCVNQYDLIIIAHFHEAHHIISCCISQRLLEWFDGSDLALVVVYDTIAKTMNPRRPIETHSHQEADTLIPIHLILSIEERIYREVDVWSPDSDLVVLLMDPVSRGHIGTLITLKLLTGKVAYLHVNR